MYDYEAHAKKMKGNDLDASDLAEKLHQVNKKVTSLRD